MADNGGGVRISNREIYDAVRQTERLLERYIATNDLRVGYLGDTVEEMAELAREQRRDRTSRNWALVLALIGPVISIPVSIWAATQGVS